MRPPSVNEQIPVPIRQSPFFKNGGFAVFQGLLDVPFHQALLSEALGQMGLATEESVQRSDSEEIRGGSPARRFLMVPGGRLQSSFYRAGHMLRFLGEVTGLALAPSGERGTYIFYARPGDYISVHRDMDTCDLVTITCLQDLRIRASTGGTLYLYPSRVYEPLSTIRAQPERDVMGIALQPGQTIVMLGGIVPHGTIPLTPAQLRIVSVLCYQVQIA